MLPEINKKVQLFAPCSVGMLVMTHFTAKLLQNSLSLDSPRRALSGN